MVRGVMHVRASGRHDYYVEPLFRLDGGHLEHYYDRFYYHVSEGATIAWHASVPPNWPGKRITYCSARGAALTGNPERRLRISNWCTSGWSPARLRQVW